MTNKQTMSRTETLRFTDSANALTFTQKKKLHAANYNLRKRLVETEPLV